MGNLLINQMIYQRLHGRQVVVEIHDEVFGLVETGPYTFDNGNGQARRLVQKDDFSMLLTFDPRGTSVAVTTYDDIRGKEHSREYAIEALTPVMQVDGVIRLELWRNPIFNIDIIRNLYDNIDSVDATLMDGLELHNHPFTHIRDKGGLLPVLYEIDFEDCIMLVQLGYFAEFDRKLNEQKELSR